MTNSVDVFDPVKFSLEECQFLLDHLGEPFTIAAKEIKGITNPNPPRNNEGKLLDKNPILYPDGVIPASVKPILDRVYELEILSERHGEKWIGIDSMKQRIKIYLDQQAKWQADKKRFPRAPRFPSMHSFDAKNKPHRGGPGSDSGFVSTYFDSKGKRLPFAMNLLDNQETGGWAPEWASESEVDTKGLRNDLDNRRIECTVCKHTETYKADSASSMNAARGRMSKHLRTSTDEVALHRELYTNEFGS